MNLPETYLQNSMQGEMTAEEVCAELDKVDRVWFEDPREPHDVPDDYISPSSNC